MSPLPRPGAAARSPFALLVLLLAPVALAASAGAAPLAPYGSYVGENRSFEDHHGEVLSGINLSEADLTSANFAGADLKVALLVDATAVDAVFAGAYLKEANFSGADLTRANLSYANLKGTDFANAILVDASFTGSEFKDADFRGAHLLGANLANVLNGQYADFHGAYFDAHTQLAPSIDDSVMYFVVGACPTNASQYWIDLDRDGDGDTCQGVSPLPEPGALSLLAGSALLAVLARRRS
jgi:uncharacterized protein YjbI with pentapeptide repeats